MSAALVPAAPVLLLELCGSADASGHARVAALEAITRCFLADPHEFVVIAETEDSGAFGSSASWDLHRIGGVDSSGQSAPGVDNGKALPIPLAIGAALLHEAGWKGSTTFHGLDPRLTSEEARALARRVFSSKESLGLLMMGNGSACCSPKAPGSLHPEAQVFNNELAEMLSAGDRRALAELSATRAAAQLSDIRLPLQALLGASSVDIPFESIVQSQEFLGVYYIFASFLAKENGGRSRG